MNEEAKMGDVFDLRISDPSISSRHGHQAEKWKWLGEFDTIEEAVAFAKAQDFGGFRRAFVVEDFVRGGVVKRGWVK